MANNHHLISLDNFLQEHRNWFYVMFFTSFTHSDEEEFVVSFRKSDTREQVGSDAPEERNIVGKKFGKINILDGSQKL